MGPLQVRGVCFLFSVAFGRKRCRVSPSLIDYKPIKSKIMNNRTYFLGLEENDLHSNDWEKDCSMDNYGLYDDEDDFSEDR